jgi:trimeric autotransporter adhesin
MAMGAAMLASGSVLVRTARAQAPAAGQAPDAGQMPGATTPDATPPAAPTPAPAVTPAEPQGGTVRGSVKAGLVPLPGVAVTAKNTLTGKIYATTTDVDGQFAMVIPKNGRYVVRAELAAFAIATKEVVVNASSENGGLPVQTSEFTTELASRAAPVETAQPSATASAAAGSSRAGLVAGARVPTAGAVARVGRGTQVVSMQASTSDPNVETATADAGNSGAQMPQLGGLGADDAAGTVASSDSVTVSGRPGQTNNLAGFSQEDLQNRIQGMQQQGLSNGDIAGTLMGVMNGGGFGGPGGGPFGGPGGPGGGGPGGGGFGGFGGGGRGGGFRGQNANQPHGSFAYTGSDSALNATPYSVTGRSVANPPSDRNTLIASVTGTPYIPGWTTPNPKQFVFLSVQETRNTAPTIAQQIVPTAAQGLGDLSNAGTVYDPYTGQPYPTAAAGSPTLNCLTALYTVNPGVTSCIPAPELTPTAASPLPNVAAAQALLKYYPAPNITPTGTQDNYQTITAVETHSSQISARYNRSFGAAQARGGRGGSGGGRGGGGRNANAPPVLRQSIAENFAYSHTANSSQNFSPQLGGKSVSNGYSFTSSYTVGYGRLNNTATAGWNRSRALGSNYFTNGTVNPAIQAGVDVGTPTIYGNSFNYGVPSIILAGNGGLADLSDATPSDTVNQTITLSDQAGWSHKRHNMRYGIDFHRIHADSLGGTNVLGSFTFSGFATENPQQQACVPNTNPMSANNPNPTCTFAASGSPIADFLLGLPQQTGITAGLSKIYLRGNSWDWYANDDWRAKGGLTISYGLRWEYFSPYSEKYGHLVNLNVTEGNGTVAISNVCATAATGCAAVGSQTLVNPDRAMYSPRIGVAWSPKYKFAKQTVVRVGYGINYNTGQYASFAQKLSFQQPFAVTQTNTLYTPSSPTNCVLPSQAATIATVNNKPTQILTLTSGFGCSQQTTQSNYGVDPNYRLGLVQVYNLDIQRTLGMGVVLNVGYNGSMGDNLDIVRAPNRNAIGILNSNSGQFNYEDSLGYSRLNVLAVNARKRLQKGVSLQATYTYAHSIDDASSIGGSAARVAQDDQNLGAEEGNSSFLQRQNLSGNWIYEPPFGANRAFLNKGGVWAKIFDGYSISGAFTFATGSYLTPSYSGTPAEIAAGTGNSLRPDRIPGVSIFSSGSLKSWFNTAAFSAPAAGTYGDASRNSIEGPGTVSVNGSLSRTVPLGETRSFEARITANNALNTVQYSGVGTSINSPQFGQVTGVTAMRSFTYTARFRF